MKRFFIILIAFAAVLVFAACAVTENGGDVPEDREYTYFDYEPGTVIIKLREPYDGPVSELFPEIEIVSAEDIGRRDLIELSGPETGSVKVKTGIGTLYEVKLRENTKKAVVEAVEALAGNPLIVYAQPVYIADGGE